MDIRALLKARHVGVLRFAFASSFNYELGRVLQSLGLAAEPDSVHEVNRAEAIAIVEAVLWKDLAHGTEIMSRATARAYAEDFVRGYADTECKLYSNGDWKNYHQSGAVSFNSMTPAAFDAGVVIISAECAVCLWVEDED